MRSSPAHHNCAGARGRSDATDDLSPETAHRGGGGGVYDPVAGAFPGVLGPEGRRAVSAGIFASGACERLLGHAGGEWAAALVRGEAWQGRGAPGRFAGLCDEARLLAALRRMPVQWQAAPPFGAIVTDPLGDGLTFTEAIAAGEASTGPIEFSAWRSKAGPPPGWSGLRVPKGLAAAAREAFKQGVDAGTWESGATLALRVTQGEALLLRRGGEGRVAVGGWLRLRRLDVVRAPAGARLGHASLGELTLPAGAELTAWNAGEFLTATARAQLQARVDAALAGEAAALTELEGLLPLAHPAIRAAVAGRPEAPGAAGLRLLLAQWQRAMLGIRSGARPTRRWPTTDGY